MKTLLLPLLPMTMMAASSAGVSAQDALQAGPPLARSSVVLTADSTKPAPKPTPGSPQQFRVVPQTKVPRQPPLLQLPRFTTPVIQHDLSPYPMPVTAGKGHPVRIPVAPPKVPFDDGKGR